MTDTASKITNWVAPGDTSGEFKRGASQFRSVIKKGSAEFPPEADRYHLYVSYACPWAHRALIVRKLKGLEKIIPYTAVHWHMQEKGWHFATGLEQEQDGELPGEFVERSPVPGHENFTHLRDVYFSVDPEYKGRFTVPTLYDKKSKRIVSNESSEIIRMFYEEFDELTDDEYKEIDLYPSSLREEIDASNEWIYNDINNGVYKSGFATTQEAYTKNVQTLFAALDRVEEHLSKMVTTGPYFYGKYITETDVRLFTTIVRFDVVYVQHFKTNIRDIRSGYPFIHRWLRKLYWTEKAFGDTTEFTHIKNHYTKSHGQINQFSITPLGPEPPIMKEDQEVPAVPFAMAHQLQA